MIKSDKSKLRKIFQKRRLLLTPAEIRQMNRNICKRILSLESISDKKIATCYLAINNEPDIKTVIDQLIKNKKTVAVCAFFKKLNEYKLVKLSNLENLKIGPYQIPQPSTLTLIDPKDIDLAFIPGLAFSEGGLRLGYGKGVYDKLMANTNALKIGIAYDFQIIDNFSSESHDLRVDFIITERRIIKTQNI